MKYGLPALALGIFAFGCGGGGGASVTLESLGSDLFADRSLSVPNGQSCASCHDPSHAFADPRQDSPTSEGAILGRFGNRQTPSLHYLAFSPTFHYDSVGDRYVGGQFWDGRAATLEAQALGPILNPIEMNNASRQEVVDRLKTGPHAEKFRALFGATVFDNTDLAFEAIGKAIAAFERTPAFSPFSSKFDFYLAGKATFTPAETRGLALFEGKAKCAICHPSRGSGGNPPLFTDFAYNNIGIPKNPQNRFYTQAHEFNPAGAGFVDQGLADTTKRPADAGRMKTPTLRNIAVTAPYFHNGAFKTLTEAVAFYNTRDTGAFGPAEVPGTVNATDMGNLGLTEAEITDVVAFLQTLTDGYK